MRSIFFLFFLILGTFCFSQDSINIEKISIYTDKNNLTYEDVINKSFEKISSNHVNFGFNNEIIIWLKVELSNKSNLLQNKIIELDNPLLENITFYDQNSLIDKSGMLDIKETRKTINPFFNIKIKANSKQIYYLKIQNRTTALQFTINITDKENFYRNDKGKQSEIIFYLGMILAFLIYALALHIYTKDRSYLFYILYIMALVFQQLTYVGFLPLYMPNSFTYVDNLLVVPKVGLLIITGILFARSFLKTNIYKNIDRFYKVLIILVILQILFLSTPWFYYPEFTILTGLVFIIFNYYTAIFVYRRGHKQARFFIIGWSFLLIGFFLSIIDALGIFSVMYNFPSLVLLCTTFEALFLLLAFVDKLNILQKEKDISDSKLMEELQQRNIVIEKKVKDRTKMLDNLYRELHHRVKNNLQIMLSIISLQGGKIDDEIMSEQFLKLENRIRSISKTHELLYLNDNIEKIDMYEYIYSMCEDISNSFDNEEIEINIESDVEMPLREAVYVGMIINELVSNTIKYAKNCNKINVYLFKNDDYLELEVMDNGLGYKIEKISTKSLGLTLVKNLVKEQLSGEIKINTLNKCEYKIRFKI